MNFFQNDVPEASLNRRLLAYETYRPRFDVVVCIMHSAYGIDNFTSPEIHTAVVTVLLKTILNSILHYKVKKSELDIVFVCLIQHRHCILLVKCIKD